MPWKECHVMDERVRFVARLLDGEKMATLCAEFGISRKTGYKIYERYQDAGVQGLTHRSRRPLRQANRPHAQAAAVHRHCRPARWLVPPPPVQRLRRDPVRQECPPLSGDTR